MNNQFIKRCEAQDVGILIHIDTAYDVGDSEGCVAVGYAATCAEVRETNPSSVRESNSFANFKKSWNNRPELIIKPY